MSSSRDAPTTTTGGAAPVYVSALPSRSTRGKRMSALLEDEDSADEAFWGQDAFAEESGDDEYESESEEVDVVDDDFHDDESSESEGEVYVARERTSKALKAPERKKPATTTAAAGGGAADRRRGMATVAATGLGAGMSGGAVVNDGAAAGMGAMGTDVGEYEPRKTKRSTAQAILQKSEQMRAERAAKPAPERQKVEYRQLTQEELLEEAKETEYWNLLDLERLLTLEAEMKKKPSTDKKKYEGPSIVHKSSIKVNGGVTVVELARGAETPTPLRQAAPTPPKPNVCVITGQPAKYKDPLTGMPYATIEAFKEVRKRYPPIEKKPDLVEEPTAAAAATAAATTTTTQAPQPIIEVKIEPPVVQPTVKGLRGKRRGKPSASKLSTLPFKTLKEEPVVADEVMTDAI